MSAYRYIQILLVAFLLTSCSQDELSFEMPAEVEDGNTCKVNVSVAIPDMPVSNTRGGLGDTPGSDLKLTILEFEKGSSAATSNLTRVYQAETTSVTNVQNGGTVTFSFTLTLTDQPRVLHLMIADEYITTTYGSVASLLPTITVGEYGSDPVEAYWGCVEFDNGYATYDDDNEFKLNSDVTDKLTDVPVIRNFSRVTVKNSATTDFTLLGFDLINIPTSGTIAPYNASTMSVPNLLATDDEGNLQKDENGHYSMKPFTEVSDIYSGILPANTSFTNVVSSARTWTTVNASDNTVSDTHTWKSYDEYVYIYERPYSSTLHTYMIIKGIYKGDNADNTTPTYYKIDLGTPGGSDLFDFYNLIRNFEYQVNINSVSAAGSTTVSGAIDGLTFNNLSADVSTNNMLSVSNGKQLLVVSNTSIVFVNSNEPIDFTYKYYTDVALQTFDNSNVEIIGLEEGDVIASFDEEESDNADGTRTIKITPNTPTSQTKTQSFTIVDGNGLGRIINLVLRTPWTFEDDDRKIIVQSGHANTPTGTSSTTIGTDVGAELTVYFYLPAQMPESVFPLQVRLQSLQQDIENNPIGTLVVSYGSTLFPTSGDTDYAISYIKTISYDEYNFMYDDEADGDVIDVNSPNTNHLIRCRFRTITSVTETPSTTTMRIANDYFTTAAFTFNRGS